ncbi:YjgB family protein [Brevibacillus sp. NRS-1366]|uniref:YjgB family protein n=1 Tax=Brevibacillus sp. NRS-1366 TaxID=3233899 RepID=UPI003D1CF23E
MPYKTDDQLLDEMKGLPDMKMKPGKKQQIVTAIRQTDAKKPDGSVSFRRFSTFGKGVAICSVLLAAVWMGSSLFNQNQPNALPGSLPQTTAPGSGSTTASTGNGSNHSGSTQPTQVIPQGEELLSLIRKQAEKGMVINAPYTVETIVFEQVEKDWGAPDRTDDANGLIYATYNSKGIVLGYNKGMQLVDIRSVDPRLQQATLSDVEKKWGNPSRVSEFGGQTIYTYDVTNKYQVKFIFQGTKSTGGNDLKLVRYNVYYPQGNKNLMLYGSNVELMQNIRDLAKNGQTLGSSSRVEKDVFDEIEKVWGKPDIVSFVNGISYNTYRDRNLVFGFNKGMQIVDIRSYDPRLQSISLAEVQDALGKPQSVTTAGGQTIYTYKVTDKYELKIIFSGVMGKKPSTLYIDHVNVYYPRGTINNMAG